MEVEKVTHVSKWEYEVVEAIGLVPLMENTLQEFGQRGYELAGVVPGQGDGSPRFIFKRPTAFTLTRVTG